MRVLLLTYRSREDVESMVRVASQISTLGSEMRLCAPPDFAEFCARVEVSLVSIGGWR